MADKKKIRTPPPQIKGIAGTHTVYLTSDKSGRRNAVANVGTEQTVYLPYPHPRRASVIPTIAERPKSQDSRRSLTKADSTRSGSSKKP